MLIKSSKTNNFASYQFPSIEEPIEEQADIFTVQEDTSEEDAIEKARLEAIENEKQAGFEAGRLAGVAAGLEEGKQTGFKAGYQEGYQEGYGTAAESVKSALSSFDSASDKLINMQDSMKDVVRQSAIQLVTSVAKKVIDSELKSNPEAIVNWIDTALDDLPERPMLVKVLMNPSDYTCVQPLLKDRVNWEVCSSDSLASGQIEVETNLVDIIIDAKAKLDKLLKEI